jgi:hypothetical protein
MRKKCRAKSLKVLFLPSLLRMKNAGQAINEKVTATGMTVLQTAVMGNDTESVKFLLASGAQIQSLGASKLDIIKYVVDNGNRDIFNLLLRSSSSSFLDKQTKEEAVRAFAALDLIVNSKPVNFSSTANTINQYVEKVLSFTRQYTASAGWYAECLVGPPTVYPRYGDIRGAYAVGMSEELENFVVSFAQPVYIDKIEIYETNVCGAIVKIEAQQLDPA